MNKSILPFLLSIFLLSACEESNRVSLWDLLPDDPTPVCDAKNATPVAERLTMEGQLHRVQVTEGSKVLLADQDALYWTDLSFGKLLHKIASPVAATAFRNTQAIYHSGDLAIAGASNGLAVVNVKTGELLWARNLDECEIVLGAYGLGDQYFVTRRITEANGVTADAVFSGNINDGSRLDLLCTPDYSRISHSWAGYGRINALVPFVDGNGHNSLLMSFFETNNNKEDFFLALYDLSARSWVYQRQALLPTTPAMPTGVQQLSILGTSAYMIFQGKILIWDIAAGKILDSIVLPAGTGVSSDCIVEVQVQEQYLLLRTSNGELQILDRASRALLFRAPCTQGPGFRAEFELDRLFVPTQHGLDIYELSSGKKVESILAPCETFCDDATVWKDPYGAIHVALTAGSGQIFHYVLQS